MGVSFAGKPPFEDEQNLKHSSFPSGHPIAKWRDETLKWPKALLNTEAGQDFFYVQNVSSVADNAFQLRY